MIFYQNEEQKRLAEESRTTLMKSGILESAVTTQILPAQKFYRAEEYHQDYYKKNSTGYNRYRFNSGRDPISEKTWKDQPDIFTSKQTGDGYQRPLRRS